MDETDYKERMVKLLSEYADLKNKERKAFVPNQEVTECAINLLKEKNAVEKEMLHNNNVHREEVIETIRQAYKDAGLYQGKE